MLVLFLAAFVLAKGEKVKKPKDTKAPKATKAKPPAKNSYKKNFADIIKSAKCSSSKKNASSKDMDRYIKIIKEDKEFMVATDSPSKKFTTESENFTARVFSLHTPRSHIRATHELSALLKTSGASSFVQLQSCAVVNKVLYIFYFNHPKSLAEQEETIFSLNLNEKVFLIYDTIKALQELKEKGIHHGNFNLGSIYYERLLQKPTLIGKFDRASIDEVRTFDGFRQFAPIGYFKDPSKYKVTEETTSWMALVSFITIVKPKFATFVKLLMEEYKSSKKPDVEKLFQKLEKKANEYLSSSEESLDSVLNDWMKRRNELPTLEEMEGTFRNNFGRILDERQNLDQVSQASRRISASSQQSIVETQSISRNDLIRKNSFSSSESSTSLVNKPELKPLINQSEIEESTQKQVTKREAPKAPNGSNQSINSTKSKSEPEKNTLEQVKVLTTEEVTKPLVVEKKEISSSSESLAPKSPKKVVYVTFSQNQDEKIERLEIPRKVSPKKMPDLTSSSETSDSSSSSENRNRIKTDARSSVVSSKPSLVSKPGVQNYNRYRSCHT